MTSASMATFGIDIDEGEGLRGGTRSPSLKMTDATEMSFDGAGDVSVGRILTADELARSLNVSTATISRWRRHGLASCRIMRDGRRRVGFSESSVRRFARQAPERIRRSDWFRDTKSKPRRTRSQMRARRIMELPLDYIPNDEFAQKQNEKEILGPTPTNGQSPKGSRPGGNVPPYLADLYEVPLLTREQEVHLFRKMNYLKYKASRLLQRLDPDRPGVRLMNQIEKCHEESLAAKNEIVRANLRLVVSIAKRYVNRSHEFFELVSDGNLALIRAVEKFDFARGHKFSTYASWAIMHSLSRAVPKEIRRRDRFRTSHGELFDATEDTRSNQQQKEASLLKCQTQVRELLRHLDKRERTIIDRRFGLANGRKPVTLKQLGAEIGVTSERVRQLEARAIGKLRRAAESEGIEFPEI